MHRSLTGNQPPSVIDLQDDLVQQAKNDLINGQTDSQIIAHVLLAYEPLIYRIASRWKHAAADMDDLLQEGRCALLRALHTYRPGQRKFSSHAYQWICAAVSRVAQREQAYRRMTISGDEELQGGETKWDILIPGDEEELEDLDRQERIQQLLENLQALRQRNPEAAHLIASYYGLGREAKSLQEIAKDLGISRQAVHKKLHAALKVLRELINDGEKPSPGP